MRASPLLVSLSLCLLLSACGGTDVDVGMDGSMNFSNSEGSVNVGSKVPADWPTDVPVIADSTVTMSGTGNEEGQQQASMIILESAKTADEVKTYYVTELKAQGWKIDGTVNMGGAIVIAASKAERGLSLQIAGTMPGKTTVTLAVGVK